jgi:hypothetical protein
LSTDWPFFQNRNAKQAEAAATSTNMDAKAINILFVHLRKFSTTISRLGVGWASVAIVDEPPFGQNVY